MQPYGLAGGEPGQCGVNLLIKDGEPITLDSKGRYDLNSGDILSIETPGGGGYGKSGDT
jgi:N-methylhydantoinase B/oxoprolinase/acetone carboxylase alpha subunit